MTKSEKPQFIRKPPLNSINVERIDKDKLIIQNKTLYKSATQIREFLPCSDGIILRIDIDPYPPLKPEEYFNIIKISPKGEFLWRLNPKNHGPKDYFVAIDHGHSEENFSANSGAGFYLEARYSDGEVVLRKFVG